MFFFSTCLSLPFVDMRKLFPKRHQVYFKVNTFGVNVEQTICEFRTSNMYKSYILYVQVVHLICTRPVTDMYKLSNLHKHLYENL